MKYNFTNKKKYKSVQLKVHLLGWISSLTQSTFCYRSLTKVFLEYLCGLSSMYHRWLKTFSFFKLSLNKHLCERKQNAINWFYYHIHKHEIIWQNYKPEGSKHCYHPLEQYHEKGHGAIKVLLAFLNAKGF